MPGNSHISCLSVQQITLPAEVVTDILNSPLNAEKTDDSMKTKKFKR